MWRGSGYRSLGTLAIDPQKLPWSVPKPNTRAPATTQTAWFQNLYGKESVRLAQAGGSVGPLQFNIPPAPGEAPTAADLAPTPEVQLTATIQAQAQALGNNPVNIHNWVRNQVEWVPTWGSIQGAQDTLDKKRGNAFDIASLEIALLRAANIPARYQLGTVEIPAAQAMNWVGGVQKPEAAVVLLNQGGIAATGLSNGGSIQAIRMEHVWVQAYVNWAPGRGSQNASANQHVNPNGPLNAWVPLDASYKQYNYTLGIGLKSVAPALGQSLSQSALQGASVTTNYAQNFNTAALLTQIANYKTQVKAYIDASTSGPGSTVDDVLGKKNIAARTHSLLGDGQSYLTVMTGVQAAEIPDNLRWKLAINLYQSDSDVANQSPSVSVSLALPQLTTKRLAISYEPASPSDQSVIDAAAQSGQLKFAAYLVRFVPKIKLDFAVLGAGYAQTPGIAGQLFVVLNGPSGSIDRSYQLTSGDTSVLSVSSSGVTAQGYFNRSENFAMSALDSSKYGMQGLTEEMLHQLGLAWWAQKFVGQDNMAALTDVVQYQLPSHALIMAPISASYFFGMVRSASYKTRAIDAKLDYISAQHKNGDLVPRREFLRAAGKYGSYLEGAVFDQAFSPFSQGGISTIGLLAEASREGLRIFKINAENANLIGQLSVDSSVQDEISAALSNGLEATISESNVSLGGYTGVGYIIENPSDGSAAYQIEGGRSGGQAQASENVVPIPAMPDNQLIGILLSSGLRTSGAKLGVDNGGMIVGLILPSVVIDGPALTALLGVLCLMIMLSQSLGAILDSIYPRDTGAGTRWRKYTKYQDFIVARLLLYASNYGTFGGDGVYVADAAAEERRGVTCSTMSPLDVATRFQIPNPEKPDPINVTGYVDIIELRKGYLTVQKFGPNSAGQLEYKITRPIIFVPELRPMPGAPSIATALVLVPGAVEIDDVCKLN